VPANCKKTAAGEGMENAEEAASDGVGIFRHAFN